LGHTSANENVEGPGPAEAASRFAQPSYSNFHAPLEVTQKLGMGVGDVATTPSTAGIRSGVHMSAKTGAPGMPGPQMSGPANRGPSPNRATPRSTSASGRPTTGVSTPMTGGIPSSVNKRGNSNTNNSLSGISGRSFSALLSNCTIFTDNRMDDGMQDEMLLRTDDVFGDKENYGDDSENRTNWSSDFHERQVQHMKAVQDRMQAIRAELEPPKAAMSQGSRKLEQKGRIEGSFMQRLQKDIGGRKDIKQKNAMDDECTFEPKINARSKSKAGKTVEEMSRGDALKAEAKRADKEREIRAQEMEAVTFAPAKIARDMGAKSKLGLSESPTSYTQKVLAHDRELQRTKEENQKIIEDAEMSQCTFRPQINNTPAFIKDLASSARASREALGDMNKVDMDQRPRWFYQ